MKSLDSIFSVSQSTFRLVLTNMTAWVIVKVSYKSHSVASFHSWKQHVSIQLHTHTKYIRVARCSSTNLLFNLDIKLFDSFQG